MDLRDERLLDVDDDREELDEVRFPPLLELLDDDERLLEPPPEDEEVVLFCVEAIQGSSCFFMRGWAR